MLLSNGNNFQIIIMEARKKTLLKTCNSIFKDSLYPWKQALFKLCHFLILLVEVVSRPKLVHEGLEQRLHLFKM